MKIEFVDFWDVETDEGYILYQANNGLPLCEIRLLEGQ